MKFLPQVALSLFVLISTGPADAESEVPGTSAIVGADVIPMDSERVLHNHTVVVREGRIVEVGPVDEVEVPDGARVIDGAGRYVIPGLADMHVHMDADEELIPLMLANGVTTIRVPNATASDIALAKAIAAGAKDGPTIYTAPMIAGMPPEYGWLRWAYRGGVVLLLGVGLVLGFMIYKRARGRRSRPTRSALVRGAAITIALAALSIWSEVLPMTPVLRVLGADDKIADSPSAAAALVRRHHANGADGIKTQWWLSRPSFDAIVATARELDMKVIGHIPKEVGVEHYLASGAEPQHDYQLFAYAATNYARHHGPNPLDRFDLSEGDKRLPKLAELMKASGNALTPTMLVYEHVFETLDHLDDLEKMPMLTERVYTHVPDEYLGRWTDPNGEELTIVTRASGADSPRSLRRTSDEQRALIRHSLAQTKVLHDAGVPILAGTDCSVFGIVWGESLHRELELMVEAGLTPYEAIETATRAPARVVGDDA